MRNIQTLTSALFCLVFMLIGAVDQPAAASPPADRLMDQVEQAYRQTSQYHATHRFEIHQADGRWTDIRATEIELAFDRDQQRLRLDRPDMTLVVRDGQLYLKSNTVPDRHLETEAPTPLTFEAMLRLLPMLDQPASPDMVFLLAENPLAVLSNRLATGVETLSPAEGDTANRPRVQIMLPNNTAYTLSIQPDSRLVAAAMLELDPALAALAPDDSLSLHYDYAIHEHNQPIDASVFDFEVPEGSTAVASLQEMTQAAGSDGRSGTLEGRNAPPVELSTMAGEPFSLDEVDADVVVLDFWATWCPPCWEGLRKLQQVHDWAEAEGRSVAIYAINLQETVQEARDYWEREALTMPVLMDLDGQAAQAYNVRAIPQTVVIADGTIHHVHVGAGPDLAEQLKTQITSLLDE